MKIEVTKSFYLESSDHYILIVRILEGKQILVGDTFRSNHIQFKVKSDSAGGYNFETKEFPIAIEKPDIDIKEFDGLVFTSTGTK